MWDHHEKFREAKIELESLIQELQKELEKLKSTCIINTEKIGYNYQVSYATTAILRISKTYLNLLTLISI